MKYKIRITAVPEIRTARAQYNPVRKDLPRPDVQHDVAQLPVSPEQVEFGEGCFGVLVRGVR